MQHQTLAQSALDYAPCRYGLSRLTFRGPAKRLDGRFVACLGGTETFGKFVPAPWPERLEQALGLTCANFGVPGGGPALPLDDAALLATCEDAAAVVIQLTGAQALSNRFYKVHPRRNDRFLAATPYLREICGEVDYADFAFTGAMLSALVALDPERFAVVRSELQEVWYLRMGQLLSRLRMPVVLLRFGPEPLFVTEEMVDSLRDRVAGVLDCSGGTGDLAGKVFRTGEESAAMTLPGPAAHGSVAQQLAPLLRDLI